MAAVHLCRCSHGPHRLHDSPGDEPTVDELEDLAQAVHDLGEDLDERIDDARRAAAEFQPGDVVEARLRGQWVEAIVRHVDVRMGATTWYRVSTRNADRSWGARQRHAYEDVRALPEEPGGQA